MKKVKADLENLMGMIQPSYANRGLRWRIPDESYGWIELIKEYRVEGEVRVPLAVQVHGGEQVKSNYEPPQEMRSLDTTTVSYPPIENYSLSSQE